MKQFDTSAVLDDGNRANMTSLRGFWGSGVLTFTVPSWHFAASLNKTQMLISASDITDNEE